MEVRKQIQEMEEQGIIRKICTSHLIVVPKKVDNSREKKYRIVVDYRKLYEVTIVDKFHRLNFRPVRKRSVGKDTIRF